MKTKTKKKKKALMYKTPKKAAKNKQRHNSCNKHTYSLTAVWKP